MMWDNFIWFSAISMLFWILAIISLYISRKSVIAASVLILSGLSLFLLFIFLLWNDLGHPPLRTMGETRLWYSFFITLVGFITWLRWRYKWLLGYSIIVSGVFIVVNLLKPEIHFSNLMPALRSIWFVPHVTVYILSYAMFGAATIASFIAIRELKKSNERLMPLIDNLIYIGLGFLMIGMILGAIWAKEAWGDYWTWDPKEVWAFITASVYAVYIHSRAQRYPLRIILWILPLAFIMLMITWLGVSYLPAAQDSIHVY